MFFEDSAAVILTYCLSPVNEKHALLDSDQVTDLTTEEYLMSWVDFAVCSLAIGALQVCAVNLFYPLKGLMLGVCSSVNLILMV